MSSRLPVRILHVRGDDGGCEIRLYDVDGDPFDADEFAVIDVDAGRGYEVSDWRENIRWALAQLPANSALQRNTLAAYRNPPNAQYIVGFDQLEDS